jgi:hypothetical protein
VSGIEVPPPRLAEVVLVSPAGDIIGALPPVPVRSPWWPEAAPVVEAVRERFGIDIVVLRMLDAERPSPPGGRVTYLAETTASVPDARPWHGTLDDHPLRMPWARPGGPATDLAWADATLLASGLRRTGPARQVRTWNLSSLWQVPIEGGSAWLKHVPPFFAHESAVIRKLAGEAVPSLIGSAAGRTLMREIPGDDHYDSGLDVLAPAVSMLVALQAAWARRLDELVAMGLPDWRAEPLTAGIREVVDRTAAELTADDVGMLRGFVDDLPQRFADVADCGLPDSLVHGDFGPGNLRGDGRTLVLLDWGDSGIGHPLLDVPAMLDRAPADAADALQERWTLDWQAAVPGSNPQRAARLLRPVGAARQSVIYRKFLDNIEPSEHPYHSADPADWLRRTAAMVRAETESTRRAR